MSVTYHFQEQEATIQVHGHFNFAQHAAFRDASRAVLAIADIKTLEVNLMDADYLDSSALGMLLVLREQASDRGIARIRISNTKPVIRQIFAVAHFEKFFDLD